LHLQVPQLPTLHLKGHFIPADNAELSKDSPRLTVKVVSVSDKRTA
jgi:hypothetical protein